MPSVASVGYTNTRKYSLLNVLARVGMGWCRICCLAPSNPIIRRAEFHNGEPFVLADTVGFVRHLFTQLVEVFRSALE